LKVFWKDTVYKNAFLLIGAAWLFTLSFIFSNYWSYTSSPKGVRKNLENYLSRLEGDFQAVSKDTSLLVRLLEFRQGEKEMQVLANKGYGVFLYKLDDFGPIDLQFWNTQESLPTDAMLAMPDGEYFVELANGKYELIRRKMTLRGTDNVLLLSLIPIRKNYYLENNYLRNGFVEHPNVEKNYSIADGITSIPISNSFGKTLYYLEQKDAGGVFTNDWVTILLRIVGSLFILFFIHQSALHISKRFGAGWGIGALALALFLVRAFSYVVPFPLDLRQFELFSPAIYGYNFVFKSLGDLLINALLFFWLVYFARTQVNNQQIIINSSEKRNRIIIALGLILSLVILTIISGILIRSLVADSQIPFDVTNFFSLNIYSIFGFMVLCSISMGYFISTQMIIKFLDSVPEATYVFRLGVVVIAALLYLTTQLNNIFDYQLGLLFWLLLYITINSRTLLKGTYFSGSTMVYWLVIFSASITVVISTQNTKKEHEKRKRIAEKLAWQADPSSEKLLNVAIGGINNDFWLNNLDRLRNNEESSRIKDSMVNANFSGYLNRYETSFHFYDENGKPLSGYEDLTYDTLATIFSMQGKKTGINNLRYYETAFDRFSYIYQREVKDSSGLPVALIFMLSNPRRYSSEAMIPELFKQSDEYSLEKSPLYAYALYNNGELTTNVNDYPFRRTLTPAETSFNEAEFREKDGYSELWFKQGRSRLVVITRKSNVFLEAITLFAYLFCAFLFLVGVFQVVSLFLNSGFRWADLQSQWQFNIRQQIFTTIIFISIFSFFIIGAATIIFFINRYNRNNQDRLSRTIQVISNEINNRLDVNWIEQSQYMNADSAGPDNLRVMVDNISEIHNVDVNLYNSTGTLSVSSQPLVYSKGILSRMMDPLAYYNMRTLRKIQFVQDEQAGRLKYLSIYLPLKNEKRGVAAYINIPYFTSSRDLNQEISNFLVTIINLNAFIFLIAGVIAVFLTNRITQSFAMIGEKMREVNLGKHNEEITWHRNDEIGGLVVEYNKMVRKLELSVADMTRAEREGAWREMARQVAHEIKNPLTPMKLSIQYLQKAIDNNAPNVKELSSSVARTLIEQIEHLAKIASEFSQFANIGSVKNEVFDLHELLYSLISLHRTNENAEFEWDTVEGKVEILADKTQINRLFTNVFQNAVEAVPENEKAKVLIREEVRDDHIVISVSDNGTGIPTEMESKIFSPNFTTKTSGTGLGLAMCKGIVEQSKGDIWFTTKTGEGTTFYISLPMAKN
jgi:signal transduction histidine kinase